MSIFEKFGQSKNNEEQTTPKVAPDFEKEDKKFNYQYEHKDGTMGFYETKEKLIEAIEDEKANSN